MRPRFGSNVPSSGPTGPETQLVVPFPIVVEPDDRPGTSLRRQDPMLRLIPLRRRFQGVLGMFYGKRPGPVEPYSRDRQPKACRTES